MDKPIEGRAWQKGFDRRAFLTAITVGLGATTITVANAKKGYAADDAAENQNGFAVSGRKAIMYDASACVGCHYCEMACKNAHGLSDDVALNVKALAGTCVPLELFPPNMVNAPAPSPVTEDDRTADRWLRVVEIPIETEKGKAYAFERKACTHCGRCAAVCPSGALKQREDGVVTVEHERCIGCKYCFQACPYDIPRFKEAEDDRAMRKCTMCSERIDEGGLPACVDACPAGALSYGSWEAVRAKAEQKVADLVAAGSDGAHLHAEDTALISVLPRE